MTPDLQWIVTRLDGKIASVSTDYQAAAHVLGQIARRPPEEVDAVTCEKIGTDALFELADRIAWDDLRPEGTPFQQTVWKKLFDLTHGPDAAPRLLSYLEFAESIGKGPGVRAVAHAVGLNPIPVIIPCHLVIPKESVERLHELENENSLFKWKTLYIVDGKIDFGEYALGAPLKRQLIEAQMARGGH